MTCAVVECSRPAVVKGFCNRHYQRWLRHGDPLGGGTSYGAPLKFYQETVLPYVGDECLIWPFVRTPDGYGQIKIEGKMKTVHRLVCIDANGPPPSPKHESAHSCGNGHLGCCTRGHLRWATTAQNQADKLVHGTLLRGERHTQAKLTEDDVLDIRRRRAAGVKLSDLADEYRVSEATISQIALRKTWGWLDDPAKIQTRKEGFRG